MIIYLKKSTNQQKKYMVLINNKKIHFGQRGYQDFILSNGNELKKKNYIARHSKMGENWEKSGIESAGFWSRWLLWNKPTLKDSIRDIEKKFNIKIIYN